MAAVTLSITTFIIMTFNITTLIILGLFATLSINDTQQNNTAIMLSVVTLSVVLYFLFY